jgi:hypothetical protein
MITTRMVGPWPAWLRFDLQGDGRLRIDAG